MLRNLSVLDKASGILAIALIVCLLPMPYGFYSLVRLATAVVACCWGYRFLKGGKTPLAVIAFAIAVLFQPLIKIVLDRITWNVIDVVLAVSIFALILFRRRRFKVD